MTGGGDRGGRGGGRGGARGGLGAKKGGAPKVILEPHRHAGVFVAKGKEHLLVTRNLVPGESVYGEKRISIEQPSADPSLPAEKIEYRVWNPFRSKLAAGILGGLDEIHIAPGKKVLYIGAASGTSVSHVADVVGPVSWREGGGSGGECDVADLGFLHLSLFRPELSTLLSSRTARDVT